MKQVTNEQTLTENTVGDEERGESKSVQMKQKDVEQKTFDDLLNNKEYQAEFDRRVQKALDTQRAKLEVIFDEKATEAEKLASMNEKEKMQYLQQKREKEMDAREAAITQRELAVEAKNTLAEKKLPACLADALNYSDAQACKQSIKAVEKAFKEAVEASVEERLKKSIESPPKKPQTQDMTDLEKQIRNAMLGAR